MMQLPLAIRLAAATGSIAAQAGFTLTGRVTNVAGLAVEIAGLSHHLAVGDRLALATRGGRPLDAEVVGFRGGNAQAMMFGTVGGLGPGSLAHLRPRRHGAAGGDACANGSGQASGQDHGGGTLAVDDRWLGRVIDPLGEPLDLYGPLPRGPHARPVRAKPPPATLRARLGPRLDLGVRVMNLFTTCRRGQRLGLFAGSGIGKSTLLAMLARQTDCDVVVLALVGERGREVREFIEDDLGADGLARAVLVVATSDSSPLMRREAGYAAMTVAEHFRDQGKSVLLLMDSVTRFCLALREIGLSAGEPPATRGYPPSVFAELPRLLERAGPGPEEPNQQDPSGSITALFTILVEGDDHNEPIADAVRGILDGHVILDRRIGEGGRYPAVDVLRSLSRTVPGCLSAEEHALTQRARAIMALHADMADMIRLGAYRAGADPAVDEAIALTPRIAAVLRQARDEPTDLAAGFADLAAALADPDPGPGPDPGWWPDRMAREKLSSLLRLRRMALDDARRDLADCLAEENRADQDLAEAEAAIIRETETARLSAGDAEVERFAAWLPIGRGCVRDAAGARARAVQRTALARAALTLSKAAAEATETLLDQHAAARRATAERQAQSVLDEVGLRPTSIEHKPS